MRARKEIFVIGILAIFLLISGSCLITKSNRQGRLSKISCILTGTVIHPSSGQYPILIVASYRDLMMRQHIEHFAVIHEAGSYELLVSKGTYHLFAFEDRDGDFQYDHDEFVGYYGEPTEVKVSHAGIIMDLNITLSIHSGGIRDFPDHLTIEDGRPVPAHSTLAGAIADLDEPIYSLEYAKKGYFAPIDFFQQLGGNIYFLKPYEAGKIPVLLVHGAMGTPTHFKQIFEHLNPERFQPCFFYYPSGSAITSMGNLLSKKIGDLHRHYHFEKMVLIAHSMGGLVSRNFLVNHGKRHPYISEFISISTPWGGVKAAETGVEVSPFQISCWRDLATGSTFLDELYKKKLPSTITFYLFFGYRGDRVPWKAYNDGTITLESQLDARAQQDSVSTFGFNEDHVNILYSKEVIDQLNTILAEIDNRNSALKGGHIELDTRFDDPQLIPAEVVLQLRDKNNHQRDIFHDPLRPSQSIGPLLPGEYHGRIIAYGFISEPMNFPLSIEAGVTTKLSITLKPEVVAMGTITTSNQSLTKSVGMLTTFYRQMPFREIRLSGEGITRSIQEITPVDQTIYHLYATRRDFFDGGRFCFFDLKPGNYTIHIEVDGYQAIEETWKVTGSQAGFTKNFVLLPRISARTD